MTYVPLPFRKPNKVVKKYTEPFCDAVGNKAMIAYVDYIDKNKKLVTEYVMYIKWDKS